VNVTRALLLAGTGPLAVVALAACSGDDDAGPTAAPFVTDAADTTIAIPTEVTTTAPPTTAPPTTASPSTTEATTTTTTTTTEPEGVVAGLPTLGLLTAGSGLGERPLLQWETVDGAAAYVVTVNHPDGGPLWAWEGPATEVPYGGGPADDPDTTGARLDQAARWFVAAFDAEGRLLAVSGRVDIAP
jgi:hypothetical protein